MSRSQKIIELNPQDGFPEVRRRLRGVTAEQVYLVAPQGCVGLEGEVRLRLLVRLLWQQSYRLAIITPDPALYRAANRIGIPTFYTLNAAEKSDPSLWPRLQLPVAQNLPRLRWLAEAKPGPRRGELMLFSGILGGLALLGLLGIVFLLPGAEVILSPRSYPLQGDFNLLVNPRASDIDTEPLTIPGRLFETTLLGQEAMATTTRKDVPDAAAQGQVVFINRTSDSVLIPKDTIISTSTGTYIRFHTLEEATLPAGYGLQVQVPIEAVEPGPSGNVEALAINRVEGVLAFQMRVLNQEPISGGTAKQVAVVSLQDKSTLLDRLTQRLLQEGNNALVGQLDNEEIMLPGYPHLIILQETYDHAVGDEAGALTLQLRVRAQGLAVKEHDLIELSLLGLEEQAGAGYQVISQGLEFHLMEPTTDLEGVIHLPVEAVGRKIAGWDVEAVKRALMGKPVAEALEYLTAELPLDALPEVRITPPGWPLMPWLPGRIEISILDGGS